MINSFILTKISFHNAPKMSLHTQNSFRTFVLSKKRTTIRASYTRYVHGIIICCQGGRLDWFLNQDDNLIFPFEEKHKN